MLAVHIKVSSEQMTWSPALRFESSALLMAAMPQEQIKASSECSSALTFSASASAVGLVVRL